MANVRVRRIFGDCYTTTTNLGNFLCSRTGKIIAVEFAISGISGAAIDAYGRVELSKSNASQLSTTDVQNTIACCAWGNTVASSAIFVNKVVSGIAIDVEAGDYIYAHCIRAGTVPTGLTVTATLYVLES